MSKSPLTSTLIKWPIILIDIDQKANPQWMATAGAVLAAYFGYSLLGGNTSMVRLAGAYLAGGVATYYLVKPSTPSLAAMGPRTQVHVTQNDLLSMAIR